MTTTTDLLTLHPDDDVAVVLTDGHAGVPAGHKVARRALPAGALVHKYGQVIGVTTAAVREGEHVHTHNLAMPGERLRAAAPPAPPVRATGSVDRTFRGYLRPDGRVGTRNFIGVLTSVNCSATVARHIARRFEFEQLPGVDGVVALTHGSGCGMADRGPGWEVLRRTLSGYARHPNIGGIVVVGLGCEVNDLSSLVAGLGVGEHVPVSSYSIQDVGGTAAAIAEGDRRVREIAERLARDTRTEVGMEHLVLGLQCGGSDGWSGLTANPALGVASDAVVAAGGTSMLGETPEIYGAEHLLAARAVDDGVAGVLLDRIAWWERYTADQGTTLDGNPSPGNKAGGITTILEKSLGAVAKGGRAPLVEVVDYAVTPTRRGLVFMDTPGYDPVSATGMVAGGATLIAFTTGRGSVFGSRPAPTVKLASNSAMAAHMADDIDVDCGPVVTGGVELAEMGERVLDTLLEVASGRPSASEALGVGGEEMVPWQLGAVL
ncbi:UxaA family hydrolase [Pseudonocardia lacus]|uniref:UxaA family hydrolase n=1 Tax=Pseudonocardia lacus TaxID=2835865 RepID=UPI001BDC625D|nr:altronate dehydratase family protein [Pseudonocardia lacus]